MGVRVLTVDDQATFRGIAREVIDATPGFDSVGEAASGEEAIARRTHAAWCVDLAEHARERLVVRVEADVLTQ